MQLLTTQFSKAVLTTFECNSNLKFKNNVIHFLSIFCALETQIDMTNSRKCHADMEQYYNLH